MVRVTIVPTNEWSRISNECKCWVISKFVSCDEWLVTLPDASQVLIKLSWEYSGWHTFILLTQNYSFLFVCYKLWSRCPRLDWWQGTDPEFVLVWNLHRNRSTGARNPLNSDHQPVMTSQIRISSADCWYPIGQNTGGGALIGPVNALSSAVCCCTCCTYSVGNNCEQTLRQIIK